MDTKRWGGFAPLTILLILAVALLAGLATPQLGAAADDGDEGAKLGDLPKAIRQALRGVEVEEVEKESKDGKTIYEVTIEVNDDAEIELALDDDGRLLGIELEDEQADDDEDREGEKDDDN